MKRLSLFFAAMLLALDIAAPASADCTSITIGADLVMYGIYTDNRDFNSDTPDSIANFNLKTKIHLVNSYTDNVKSTIRIDADTTKDDTKQAMKLDRAYIEMKEFLADGVTLRIGKMSWGWQFRNKPGAGTLYKLVEGDMENAFVLKIKPIGIDFKYAFSKESSIYFGWGKEKEGSVAGNNANDIDVFLIRYDQKLEAGSAFVAFIYWNDNTTPATLLGDMWYLNFGVDYFLMEESLELYFEFAYQDGDSFNALMDFGAMAFNLGSEYVFTDIESVPFIGLDITYYQGADGTTYGYQRYKTNFNHTLIAESDFFGRIWDAAVTGYTGIKINAGLKSLMNEKVSLDVVLGFFTANGDMPAGRDKGLGWEIDIVASYYYTEDVTFVVGIGYFDPNEDLAGANPDAMMIAVFGCNLTF